MAPSLTSGSRGGSGDEEAARLLSGLLINIDLAEQSDSSSSPPRTVPVFLPGSVACSSDPTSTDTGTSPVFITCKTCLERSPSLRCTDCNKLVVCGDCIVKCLLGDHNLLRIQPSPVGSKPSEMKLVIYCEQHGEPLEFYCKSCTYCICRICTMWFHKEHKYIPIQDDLARGRIHVLIDVQNTKAITESIKDSICQVKKLKKSLNKQCNEAVRKIKHEMNYITQDLRHREKQLSEKLYWSGRAKNNEAEQDKSKLFEMYAKLTQMRSELYNCKETSGIDIFKSREKSRVLLEECNEVLTNGVEEERVLAFAPAHKLLRSMRQQCDVISVSSRRPLQNINLPQ